MTNKTPSATDLVERLRGRVNIETACGNRTANRMNHVQLMDEAADTITRLQAALNECAGALTEARERIAARTCGMTPTLERIDLALSSVGGAALDDMRQQGQAEGFAAAVQWLRDRSACKPRAPLWSAANELADAMEQSRRPGSSVGGE